MWCVPLFDQASKEAYRRISAAVVQRCTADPADIGAAADEATVRNSMRGQLLFLRKLPMHILVGLAALVPEHVDDVHQAVVALHVPTPLERVRSTVRGVPATFLQAHACQDCPNTWFSDSGSDRPHRTSWQ